MVVPGTQRHQEQNNRPWGARYALIAVGGRCRTGRGNACGGCSGKWVLSGGVRFRLKEGGLKEGTDGMQWVCGCVRVLFACLHGVCYLVKVKERGSWAASWSERAVEWEKSDAQGNFKQDSQSPSVWNWSRRGDALCTQARTGEGGSLQNCKTEGQDQQ